MPLAPVNELKLALAQVGVSAEVLQQVLLFVDDLHNLIRSSADAAAATEVNALVQAAKGLGALDLPPEMTARLVQQVTDRVCDLLGDPEEVPAVDSPAATA